MVPILELAFILSLKPNLSPHPFNKIIGHRGAGKLAPENTLAAFKLAKTLGLNWVEFDTQICGSGDWVVIHDDTLDRTSNGTGYVQKTSLKSIKSLDAGSWFDPRFQEESIPLLSEVLDLLADLTLQPNIELKGEFKTIEPFLADFLEILKTHWPTPLPTPLLSSFSLEILLALQQKAPAYPLGYNVHNIQPDTLDIMLKHRFFSLHVDHQQFNSAAHSTILQAPFPLLLYTVNDPALAKLYFQQGVSALFSDFPNLFIRESTESIAD